MGRDKALLPWPPQLRVPQVSILRPGLPQPSAPETSHLPANTLLSAAILALKPLAGTVIVVAGKNAESLAPVIDANSAILVRNPDPDRGQFSSLQVGLNQLLSLGCDAAIISPVDCPPLSAASLALLQASFTRAVARDLWAVAPENNGRHGHPLFVNRELIGAFLATPATGNARQVLHQHAQRIEYVPVPDSLAKAGLNTPADYDAALAPEGSTDADPG